MLTDADTLAIRAELKRLKLGRSKLRDQPDIDTFLADIDDLLIAHLEFQDFFDFFCRKRGIKHFHKKKYIVRQRLAYQVALLWALHGLPKPRPSSDTCFNDIMGILFELIGLPVGGKIRRNTLRAVLNGCTKCGTPPPWPLPDYIEQAIKTGSEFDIKLCLHPIKSD